jgi:2-polyprenyl-3-methyl-5-hydroxy-6-metoxy-1,4-benzoquinol methylase
MTRLRLRSALGSALGGEMAAIPSPDSIRSRRHGRHRRRHHETVERLFASVAAQHADGYTYRTRSGLVYARRRELVANVLAAGQPGDLLDVGCGTGVLQEIVEDLGYTYRGIDSSAEMIAEARAAHDDQDGSHYSVGRIEQLELPGGSVDVVLALGVIEYVLPEEQPEAFDELARVLRPNGVLILSLLNRTSPLWTLRRMREELRSLRARLRHEPYFTNAPEVTFSSRRIRKLIAGSRLDLVEDRLYGFALVPSGVYARHPERWARTAMRLELLRSTPLRFLGLAHLVVGRSWPAGGRVGALNGGTPRDRPGTEHRRG